jgi:hypothetical protein
MAAGAGLYPLTTADGPTSAVKLGAVGVGDRLGTPAGAGIDCAAVTVDNGEVGACVTPEYGSTGTDSAGGAETGAKSRNEVGGAGFGGSDAAAGKDGEIARLPL